MTSTLYSRKLGWLASFGCCLILSSAALAADNQCRITISDPKPGANVSDNGDVQGTAEIPAKTHLWVLAHRKGFAQWWPQGGGPADIQGQNWTVTVYYGTEKDVGSKFEVAAVVVNDTENQKLQRWVDKSNSSQPIAFPNTFEGCNVEKLTVAKTGH